MYSSLTIENFRGISHLSVGDLKRVNLFIGKNNCGKTSVLEAVFLCTGAVNAQLPLRINSFRDLNIVNEQSWALFFHRLNDKSPIVITAEQSAPYERRTLRIAPRSTTITYSHLNAGQRELTVMDRTAASSGPNTGANGLILHYSLDRNGESVHDITVEVAAEGDRLKIKNPPPDYREFRKAIFLNAKNMSVDLGPRFTELQVRKQTDRLLSILREIEPALRSIVSGADGLLYCDVDLAEMLPVNVMGDGMFRLLAVVLAISTVPGGVVLIDEIENGFYYSS